MEKLQVKIEHLPSRCEVCHQSDLFDAEKSFCKRCDISLEIRQLKLEPSSRSENYLLAHQEMRQLMPLSYFLSVCGSVVITFFIINFIKIINTINEGFISAFFWVIIALSYLFSAWYLLLITRRHSLVEEIIVVCLNFIFGIIVIMLGLAILHNYHYY